MANSDNSSILSSIILQFMTNYILQFSCLLPHTFTVLMALCHEDLLEVQWSLSENLHVILKFHIIPYSLYDYVPSTHGNGGYLKKS